MKTVVSILTIFAALISNSQCYVDVACGAFHTLAIQNNGSLWACGENIQGQLGNSSMETSWDLIQISSDTNWKNVFCGSRFSLAIKNNGELWAWGANESGQFGNGTTNPSLEPIFTGINDPIDTLVCGYFHVLMLKQDGTLWSWGNNDSGQLGHGDNNLRTVPTQIGTDNDWVEISTNGYHSVAIKSDGTLWSWGGNLYGQCGQGMNANINAPMQVETDEDWIHVSAGAFFTVGTKSDGTIWGCGDDSYGQLGIGSVNPAGYNLFFQLNNAQDWLKPVAGHNHLFMIKSNGDVWASGYNTSGQLGIGSLITQNMSIETELDNSPIWSTKNEHSCSISSSGDLSSWGYNYFGQLGFGTNTDVSTPEAHGNCMTSSVTELLAPQMRIVSNQSDEILLIEVTPDLIMQEYQIYSSLGQLMLSGTFNSRLNEIYFNEGVGCYFIYSRKSESSICFIRY